MTTQVVNRTKTRPREGDVYIGRPELFGNPFTAPRDGELDQVLDKFEKYFLARVEKDAVFKAAVERLRGKRLLCWCRPTDGFGGELMCHGQVIAGYLDGVPPRKVE